MGVFKNQHEGPAVLERSEAAPAEQPEQRREGLFSVPCHLFISKRFYPGDSWNI